MTTLSRGSEWHRWDPHIHSPLSALNNQFPKLSSGEPDWEAYISALEKLPPEVKAIGVTDYFAIDGYKRVLHEKHENGRLANIDLILPNIEFRLDKIIDTSKGKKRVNYHVIFSDRVTPEQIEEHFLSEIKFFWEADPDRTDLSLSVREENLTLMGQRLKKEHAEFRNRSDYEIGCTCATVSHAKIKEVLDSKDSIFKGQYLIVLADEHLSLMEWDSQDHLTRKLLLQGANAIFSSNANTIAWAAGGMSETKDEFIREFKSLKPCIHGSDAHKLEAIGLPHGNRFCWIKAEVTFEGLRQILYEPEDRVYIGEKPANLKNDYQIIQAVTVTGGPDWFDNMHVPLNEDLVSIIGPRGSGKSALAELIAFAGGASVFREAEGKEDTFLYKASRKSEANPNPITGTTLTIHWKNGETDPISIPLEIKNPAAEEKVKYLPQKFVEWLCAPENNQELEAEIEKVIYQRNKKTDRLQASNFKELRKLTTKPIETKRARIVRAIQSLNASIAAANARLSMKSQKQTELKRKQDEKERLLKNPPSLPPENKEELANLDRLEKEKQTFESQIISLTEQSAALSDIDAKFDVLKQDLASFNTEIADLLIKAGLTDSAFAFAVSIPNIAPATSNRRTEILKSLSVLRGPTAIQPGASPARSLDTVLKDIAALKEKSKLTETKKKEYEKFQQDQQKLDELISSIAKEIDELTKVVEPKMRADQDARLDAYLDAFSLLKEERAVLEQLYEPLKEALQKSNETAKKLTFISKTTFDIERHASRGMELFDRRKSRFTEKEQLEAELRKFFDTIQLKDFEREEVRSAVKALLAAFSPGTLPEQLRKGYSPKDFADWFFNIDALATTYGIKFDNKDLKFLSPGEKGIVLLLLYLEAEEGDNRPLIIDQPDDNLDNLSVYPNLIDYFRSRKRTRQIVIITHNPNLVVNTDSEQVIVASFDGTRLPKIQYRSGALEDSNRSETHPGIREEVCKILEGGTKAFQLREARYSIS